MNLLTNAVRLVYLAVGLLAVVFVTDFTGFDKEFGAAYHKYIKAPLIKYDILKNRLAVEPSPQEKKEASEESEEKVKDKPSTSEWLGNGVLSTADRLLSATLDKFGNLIFSPFSFVAFYVLYVMYINKGNHKALASFRLI